MESSEELLAWFASYLGLDYRSALELAKSEGRSVRVIIPGGAWHDDLIFERLNICTDGDENIQRMWPG